MQVFLAFAREAMDYAIKSDDPAWSDRELDQRCRDFLLSIVVDAWEDKGKDLGVRKMASSTGWGYSIHDDAKRKLESSPEWKQYRELLLGALDAQSARPEECKSTQADGAAIITATICAAPAAQPASGPDASELKSLETDSAVVPVEQHRLSKAASKRKQNSKYEEIDEALRSIAESLPRSREDVFRALHGRVPVPNVRVFFGLGGWIGGFQRDSYRAGSWLSKRWAVLNLPAFPRGPGKR
jgi:hypothetical protein